MKYSWITLHVSDMEKSVTFWLDNMIDKLQKTANVSAKGPFSPNQSIKFYMVSDPDGYQIQLYENL